MIGVLLLAATAFYAHFLHFKELGLYEDDYWSIANTYHSSATHLRDIAIYDFVRWPTGRPLNHLLPSLLAAVGYRLGGLHAMYLIAAAWLSLNAALVYGIARRFVSSTPAMIAGLAYILYPADTTKELLVHAAHIQGAMTFLLLGLLLWLQGGWRRILAYPIAGLSLLSYETAFIGFMLAPCLALALGRGRKWREWLAHGAGCGVLLAVVAYFRLTTGDSRSEAVLGQPGTALYRALTSLWLGPETGVRAFGHGLLEGFARFGIAAFAGGLVLIAGMVLHARLGKASGSEDQRLAVGVRQDGKANLPLVVAACAVTWSASYILTLVNYPPTQIMGRFTSTHIAAGWPVALLCGCIAQAVTRLPRMLRTALAGAAAVCAMLLLSNALYIQSQYAAVWRVEKNFWRQILKLCPDVDAHTCIVVAGTLDPRRSPIIMANSWADYHACVHLFGRAPDGSAPRFAHLGVMGSTIQFRRQGGKIEWNPEFWSGSFVPLDPRDLILLRSDKGRLTRVQTITTPSGPLESLRPAPTGLAPEHRDTLLFRLIEG